MSTSLHKVNLFEEHDDDVWFDALEDQSFEELDRQVDEKFNAFGIHAYVANPAENHYPELPTVALQRGIASFYMQEPAPFEQDDPDLESLFGIEEALHDLQERHAHAMQLEDRKFRSVVNRFDETAFPLYEPENTRTYADLKEERISHVRKLGEITKAQELLEREYRVEVMELRAQAMAILDKWHANQESLADQHRKINDNLVMEDRVRWGILRQKQLEHANFGMQELVDRGESKIRELENIIDELQRKNNKAPYTYHHPDLEREARLIKEEAYLEGPHQMEYQNQEVPAIAANARESHNDVAPNNQQLADYNSYINVIEYEGEEGRMYALQSRDPVKRAFALDKYQLDLEKKIRDNDKILEGGDPFAGDKEFARNWAERLGDPARSAVDPNVGVKRTFSDYDEDEDADEQHRRKRLRPISRISRTPSYPTLFAHPVQEGSNDSEVS